MNPRLRRFFTAVIGGAGGGAPVEYLLRDEFVTDEAAQMVSPRTCEPGPGTLTVVGADSYISGGVLVPDAASDGWGTRGVWGSEISRTVGLCIKARAKQSTSGLEVGFDDSNKTNNIRDAIGDTGGQFTRARANGGSVTNLGDTLTWNTYHEYILAARSTGMFYILDGKLLYVSTLGNGTLYPAIDVYRDGVNVDYMRVYQLPAPWDSDYGIAGARVASPAVDETITNEANAILEMTWTAVTGETWELSVRRTDDDNRWIVRCDQAGGTIKLLERNGGTETERSSAAQTWTNGTNYRLVVTQEGKTIKTYVDNVPKNSYTSATFNQTATGVITNKAGVNLVAWPHTLSGAALAALEAV